MEISPSRKRKLLDLLENDILNRVNDAITESLEVGLRENMLTAEEHEYLDTCVEWKLFITYQRGGQNA